ncbi:hypothetical protein K2173_012543 [Erythroxylum novogranatense]|uniref:LysM domain-containing protein n=1 Tax=Erythroxylum novogranatense TaxID=1862640 RepID=A0AAV8TJB8_9ROSI|nr:hypothetical protein K2173_012543 [Erythroxylum novogranatense]
MISSSSSPANLCLCLLCLCCLAIESTAQQKFKCSEGTTCRSLVGYRPYNGTTISDIQKYFGVRNLRTLLGANNLPISTPRTYRIQPKQLVSVPIPCICFNGTGVSNRVPIYTVQPDDGLYYIATTMFSGLVEYPKIQEVNKIPDANLIDVGQKLWIPLPCSCEEVDGEEVVHYAHVVQGGSTVEEIADEFGTTNTNIYKLNGIASNAQLIEGKTIDIPLRG